MLLDPAVLKDMMGTVALLALLAVAYGSVMRAFVRPALAQAVLGTLFGGAAVLSMLDPIVVAPGVILDLRIVPVILSAAFLGLPGAAATLLVAGAGRLWIGGAGAGVGVIGIILATLAGLAWAGLARRNPRLGGRDLFLLATLSLLHLLAYLLLPWEVAQRVVVTVWPAFIPLEVASILVVATLLERERRLAGEERRLARAATRDPLMDLLNRRGLEAEVARLPEHPRGAALLTLDLDHFKRVNDQHGHAAGDAVLRSLAARLRHAAGPGSMVARVGGEEVVVFLPGASRQDAADAAERLCEVVRARPFALPGGGRLAVTTSLGGAWTGGRIALDALMGRADGALYAAKSAGRDGGRLDVEAQGAQRRADLPRAALRIGEA